MDDAIPHKCARRRTQLYAHTTLHTVGGPARVGNGRAGMYSCTPSHDIITDAHA